MSCTFYANVADSIGPVKGEGSAVYCSDASPSISRSIIAFGTEGEAVFCQGTSAPTLSCCDVYGNLLGDWTGCIASQVGLSGNFSSDPCFCDPNLDDLSVCEASPCLPAANSCGELVGAFGSGCVTSGVADNGGQTVVPISPRLLASYPNPFNASTRISYLLPVASAVRLRVFDVLGREVDVLADGPQAAGEHSLVWDAADRGSGVYFLVLETASGRRIQKALLLK
jgi:hypothetical protein